MTSHELARKLLAGPDLKVCTASDFPTEYEEITVVFEPFKVKAYTHPMRADPHYVVDDAGTEEVILI